MNSKIILLNGPKGCGKTEAVTRIQNVMSSIHNVQVVNRRCKDHLWKLAWEFFCMTPEAFFSIYENREIKETPVEEFTVSLRAYNALADYLGKPILSKSVTWDDKVKLSVRDALIYVSEILCKPTFGSDYFGIARAKSIREDEASVDDSCGFDEEIQPTIDRLGQGNILLIRIHGRGTFDGDSRNYISDGIVNNSIDITNVKDEESFLKEISKIAKDFYLT